MVLAGANERFEHLHAEVVDVLGVLKSVQIAPIPGVVVRCSLDYLLGLLGEPPLHIYNQSPSQTSFDAMAYSKMI